MTTNLHAALKAHLDENETLVWTGQPRQGIFFRPADAILIPFSLLILGFLLKYMQIFLFEDIMELFVALFFMGFMGMFLIGRFFADARLRKNSVYGITEDRLIIQSGLVKIKVQSIHLKSIAHMDIDEGLDGSGTITLGSSKNGTFFAYAVAWMPLAEEVPSLQMIPRVRSVYKLIIDAQQV